MEIDGKLCVHLDGSTGAGFSRLEVLEGRTGRRRLSKAERARIAAESLLPGASVADVARRHGTTRWQVYDWRKKLQTGQLVVSESVAALPMFAELVVDGAAAETPPATDAASGLQIVVGDVVKAGHLAESLTRADLVILDELGYPRHRGDAPPAAWYRFSGDRKGQHTTHTR